MLSIQTTRLQTKSLSYSSIHCLVYHLIIVLAGKYEVIKQSAISCLLLKQIRTPVCIKNSRNHRKKRSVRAYRCVFTRLTFYPEGSLETGSHSYQLRMQTSLITFTPTKLGALVRPVSSEGQLTPTSDKKCNISDVGPISKDVS